MKISAKEYESLSRGAAIVERNDRTLIEIHGRDRVSWLHNLTTNQIKTLHRNEGNYAFATNAKGRILFDLIVVNRGDCLWVSVDKAFLERAIAHFNKYIVMEDVQVRDRSAEFAMIGVFGPKAPSLLAALGLPQVPAMSQYSVADLAWSGQALSVMRDDFCGPFGVEVIVPMAALDSLRGQLNDPTDPNAAMPVSDAVVQVRRIEAGIPWPGREITDEYLPAETRQLDRAVSFQKGCYLGQEVVERMRSRHVVARLLCGLVVDGDVVPPENSALIADDGSAAGTLTSVCRSPALGAIIGLGYLKIGLSEADSVVSTVVGDHSVRCKVVALPHVTGTA